MITETTARLIRVLIAIQTDDRKRRIAEAVFLCLVAFALPLIIGWRFDGFEAARLSEAV